MLKGMYKSCWITRTWIAETWNVGKGLYYKGLVQHGYEYGILVKAPKRHVGYLPRYSARKVAGLISDE